MPFISVGKENSKDIEVYYKDWGSGQPVVFSHGWPLSADDWDAQKLYGIEKGYHAIAHAGAAMAGRARSAAGSYRSALPRCFRPNSSKVPTLKVYPGFDQACA